MSPSLFLGNILKTQQYLKTKKEIINNFMKSLKVCDRVKPYKEAHISLKVNC